jgi:glycosyltransferase involved in cell wall biosynthesis
MEWIIIDDGTDKIEDLVAHIPQVKYFKYDEKMLLGRKRNLAHEKATGDIIVSMDDDDYYPPERVSHAVEMLRTNPKAMCAGSSEMHVYFKHISQMYRFGPYGPNHSTAATFAFRKELLKMTKFDDNAAVAEEREFLKGYTIPFVQLDTTKSILVFSHDHNSFDRKSY